MSKRKATKERSQQQRERDNAGYILFLEGLIEEKDRRIENLVRALKDLSARD